MICIKKFLLTLETNKVWGGTATALYNYFTFQLSTSIQSITCHAPLLSSDKWISKTVEVVVKGKEGSLK